MLVIQSDDMRGTRRVLVIQSDDKQSTHRSRRIWESPPMSLRAAEGEAGVVSEGSGSEACVIQSDNIRGTRRMLVIQSDDNRGTRRSRRIWE